MSCTMQTTRFQVVGEHGEVEVKGTAFSVRADEGEAAVVLERGRVDVTCLCGVATKLNCNPGKQ